MKVRKPWTIALYIVISFLMTSGFCVLAYVFYMLWLIDPAPVIIVGCGIALVILIVFIAHKSSKE